LFHPLQIAFGINRSRRQDPTVVGRFKCRTMFNHSSRGVNNPLGGYSFIVKLRHDIRLRQTSRTGRARFVGLPVTGETGGRERQNAKQAFQYPRNSRHAVPECRNWRAASLALP
jgi:hypothetical protein